MARISTLAFPLILACLLPALALAEIDAPNGLAEKPITIEAPTHNVDGSLLTDLALLRLHWIATNQSSNEAQGDSMEIPFTEAGGMHIEDLEVQTVGEYGDLVTITYFATAVDAQGNVSDPSGEISETFRIVDNVKPLPPTIRFGVPVSRSCRTPSGEVCGLEPVG